MQLTWLFRLLDRQGGLSSPLASDYRLKHDIVLQGTDGYLRVNYERLGMQFRTCDQWRVANKG